MLCQMLLRPLPFRTVLSPAFSKVIHRHGASLHLNDESLEVFTLGMVDADGVVGWLVELVEDAYVAAALCGSCEDGKAKLVFVDGL